ncbi:Luciferin 4-monooxygenase, partial [Operophtera brumata]
INGDSGEKTTYKQLLQGTVDLAAGLSRIGVCRGDVVALCGQNTPQYLTAALAALCCGATITTLNLILKTIIQLDGTAVERSVLLLNSLPVAGSHILGFEPAHVDGSDGAFILYSSGTTGLPKGVMLSNLNVLYSIALFE